MRPIKVFSHHHTIRKIYHDYIQEKWGDIHRKEIRKRQEIIHHALQELYQQKRICHFLAGRHALHLCISYLKRKYDIHPCNHEEESYNNDPHTHSPYLPDTQGAPLTPPSIVASISHTRHMAVAMAGLSQSYRSLGIDLEAIFLPHYIEEVKHSPFFSHEKMVLDRLPLPQQFLAYTLVFSAKEALIKAICYDRKQLPPLQHIHITHINLEEKFMIASLSSGLGFIFSKVRIYFLYDDHFVFTYVFIPHEPIKYPPQI